MPDRNYREDITREERCSIFEYAIDFVRLCSSVLPTFLVVATERGRERNGYHWVNLSDVFAEFSYGEDVICEM